jgi:predicted neutral ceramidase superfamily lipid hydrolase
MRRAFSSSSASLRDMVVSMPAAKSTLVRTALIAGLADAILILVFAAIGRDAHQPADVLTGVFSTAWPFLAGAAIGWLAARVWRAPFQTWPAGVAVWIGTVAGGMLLRAATGQTVVIAFIIVALISLAILLLGYRAVIALVVRVRRRSRQS